MSDRNDDDGDDGGRREGSADSKSPWKWVGSADKDKVGATDSDGAQTADAAPRSTAPRSTDAQDRPNPWQKRPAKELARPPSQERSDNPWQRRESRPERSDDSESGRPPERSGDRSAGRSARGGRGDYGGRTERPEPSDRPERDRPERGGRGPWQRREAVSEDRRPPSGKGSSDPWGRRSTTSGGSPDRGQRPERSDRVDRPERADRPNYSKAPSPYNRADRGQGGDQPRRRSGPSRDARPAGGPPPRGGRPSGPPQSGRPGGPWGGRGEHREGRREGRPPAREKQPEPQLSAKSLSVLRRLNEVEVVEIEIEKLVAGGDGFGRYDGIPIFVPKSAPGDLLKVRLTERKTGFGRGEVVEILKPGEGRREPPCSYFDRCGGCDLQHLDEESQLRLKVGSVRETLRRIGGVETVPKIEIIPSPAWAYRTRAQLHVERTERGREVGYYARGSQQLVAVDCCPILVPELEEALPSLARKVRDESHARIDLAAGDESWTSAPPSEQLPQGEVQTQVGDFAYTWDARCFFQGNRHLVGKLVEHAIGDFSEPEGIAYDLFAGVGLFSLPLSRAYRQVVAVEGERLASRFLRRNAKDNAVHNVDSVDISIESWIRKQLPEGAARVLVDPPRSGLSGTVLGALLRQRPKHVTYVSCQPATLARDLKKMAATFRIDRLTLLDMFPQTGHMEAVVQLSLRDSDDT